MKDDATRVQLALKRKGERAHEDMKRVSAKIEIPSREMEQFLDEITAGSLELALRRIATRFTTKTTQAQDLLKEIATQAPLQATIGIQKIADAQIIAQVGSVHDDPEGEDYLATGATHRTRIRILDRSARQDAREIYANRGSADRPPLSFAHSLNRKDP